MTLMAAFGIRKAALTSTLLALRALLALLGSAAMGAGAKIVYTRLLLVWRWGMITLVQYAAYSGESLEVVHDNGWALVGYHSIPITLVRMALQPLSTSRYECPVLFLGYAGCYGCGATLMISMLK